MSDKKVISSEEGEAVAKENGMQFFETSAKSGVGIQEAFESIAKAIIEKLESEKA